MTDTLNLTNCPVTLDDLVTANQFLSAVKGLEDAYGLRILDLSFSVEDQAWYRSGARFWFHRPPGKSRHSRPLALIRMRGRL